MSTGVFVINHAHLPSPSGVTAPNPVPTTLCIAFYQWLDMIRYEVQGRPTRPTPIILDRHYLTFLIFETVFLRA